jgi:hypothetical protein
MLKVGADKAGRNAKCSKCGTVLKIPASNEAEPTPAAEAPTKKPADDDEGGQAYGLKEDVSDPAEEVRKQEELNKPKAIKKPGRVIAKKQAQITNPDEWRKVAFGCRIIAVGLGMWLAAYLLYRVPLVVGMAQGEEYAAAADKRLVKSPADTADPGNLDIASFAVAVITGDAWVDSMLLVVRLALVLAVLAYLPLLAGYVTCLVVPNRFGTRLQLMVLLALALINAVLLLVFRLLPMFGVVRYTILAIIMPEVGMTEMNTDRYETLTTFWLKSPVLEVNLVAIVTFLHYLEPALIATFIHAVGKSVKSEQLEASGLTAMMLGFSQIFIQTVWLMASWCGTSMVLIWVLRFVYTLGAAFFVYQLIYTITLLFGIRGVIEEQLGEEGQENA